MIKKMFIVLLSNIVNGTYHTQCMSLSNQKRMIQPTIINLHPNEYSQEFHYYTFAIRLDICLGSCNNDLFRKACVPNETEDLNLSMFNIITEINESKALTNCISCKCKSRFDGKNFSSIKWWNNDKC